MLSLLLTVALLCALFPQLSLPAKAAATSGICGENLTWSFDETTGTLTITGSGDMTLSPWNPRFRGKLKAVSLPFGLTRISPNAFEDCVGLAEITIPDSVTYICESAFYGCSGLMRVIIPDSVTRIDDQAFRGCSSLTSVTIPDSMEKLGDDLFMECSSLSAILVASDNSYYCSIDGVLFSKDASTLLQYPGGKSGAYHIPDSVTYIKSGAFSGFESLANMIGS